MVGVYAYTAAIRVPLIAAASLVATPEVASVVEQTALGTAPWVAVAPSVTPVTDTTGPRHPT